jgi:hypothetical protein
MKIKDSIILSARMLPKAEGPIPVTETSHPFCDMRFSRCKLDLAEYGYLEEEYFLSGTANVYDEEQSDKMFLKHEALPYKNRILVRRPAEPKKFSGRVYIDILNATNNFDIEDLWLRSYSWILENGHGYIGVTSKPVCVMSLKYFDYERYAGLNWASVELAPQPVVPHPICGSVPGTEEGLIWDMLSQVASIVRYGGKNNCLGGYPVNYLYLTGQSQSGAYINTYVNHFHPYLIGKDGQKLFDGYMNIVGVQFERFLCQRINDLFVSMIPRHFRPINTPFISVTSEGDLEIFAPMVGGNMAALSPDNSDTSENKSRYYEVAGAPHTNITAPVLQDDYEIAKSRNSFLKPGDKPMNDLPLAYYINGLLEKLHIWAAQGVAPEAVQPIEKSRDFQLVRDEYGNVKGGLRSPFLDVPAASYYGSVNGAELDVTGVMERFSKQKLVSLYGSTEAYLEKFDAYTDRQRLEGWIIVSDSRKMKIWAREMVNKAL